MSGASATLTFPTAGSFSYSLTGSNAAGAGVASTPATLTVTPVAATCVPQPVAGLFPGSIARSVAIARGGSVTWSLPIYTVVGRTLEILSSQTTSTEQGLTSEFTVSTCPGDFTRMQAECDGWGGVETSGTQLIAATAASVLTGTCTVVVGQQYYLNVRNIALDRVTPACAAQTCFMNVHLNTF